VRTPAAIPRSAEGGVNATLARARAPDIRIRAMAKLWNWLKGNSRSTEELAAARERVA
jgi:hypothetical protein